MPKQGEQSEQGPHLREQERQMLLLLAGGLTDEVVAERLGLTRRTLQRRLRRAFDSLGAQSRFQAGFLFARLGDSVQVRGAPISAISGTGDEMTSGETPYQSPEKGR